MLPSIDPRLNLRVAKQRLTDPRGMFKFTEEKMRAMVLMSQSYLRFEVTLQRNVTEYQFPIVITQQAQNGVAQSVTEQRLQLQDSFFVSHLGYFFQVAKTKDGNEGYVNQLYTYPTSKNQNLGQSYYGNVGSLLWNASMSLTVQNRVQCPAWDTFRHYYVPQTQSPYYSAPVAASIDQDEQDGSQYGFYPVEPNWTLVGSKNNNLTVTLPFSPGTAIEPTGSGAFTGIYRLVVIVRGILAQNSTSVG